MLTLCALANKKAMYKSILISLLKLMRNILKHHFSGRGVLLNSVMDIHYSTTEGGANQNWMDVDVKGAAIKTFHFVEVVNE